MRRAYAVVAVLATTSGLAACEAFLTDPAPAPIEVGVEFQVTEGLLGGPAQAFAKIRRAEVRFVRPDLSFRDTTFFVQPIDGRIRIPISLDVGERVDGLGIAASLGFATTMLFEGAAIVRIVPGEPTSTNVPIVPIPDRVRGAPAVALVPNVGESVQLTSAVLFASGDTITGLDGTWLSEDPSIIDVTPDGLATALRFGQTLLEVSYDTFADTIVALTSPVDTIVVTPDPVALTRGATQQLSAVLEDALGNELLGRPLSWASLDPSIATVDASGLVTGVEVGSTTVEASSGGATTTVAVSVSGPLTARWIGGDGVWSDPLQWSTGIVPRPGDSVEITVDGSYTVTLDVDPTVASVVLGGGSGAQTLVANGRSMTVTGPFDVQGAGAAELTSSSLVATTVVVAPGALLLLDAATVSAPIDNQGTVEAVNTSTLSGALTTSSGSVLRVNADAATNLTVTSGFTNNGLVELTSELGSPSTLTVSGTLDNGGTGTISVIGAGARTINAALDNRGTFQNLTAMTLDAGGGIVINAGFFAPGAATTILNADAFTDTGTLDLSGGDVTVTLTGAGAGFSTTGGLALGAGRTLTVENGSFVSTTVSGSGILELVDATVSGAGLTVSTTATVVLDQTTVNAPSDNQGTLEVVGSSTLAGGLTTASGSVLAVDAAGATTLTVAGGFINNGLLELTSPFGDPASLSLTGTLTNAATGTILTAGTGSRTIDAPVRNLGTIDLGADLSLTGRLIDPVGAPSNYKGNGSVLSVVGLDVDGAVFGNVPLVSKGGSLIRFDNVTFSGMDPTATQLTIDHPGPVGGIIFNNPTFTVEPTTGLYILAIDSDGTVPLLQIDLENAFAGKGPVYTVTVNGAIVNWL